MISKLASAVILIGSATILNGCGSAKDAIDNLKSDVQNPDLIHTWENAHCSSSKILGASYKVQFTFSGSEVKKEERYYTSADCQNIAGTITYAGKYEKKNEIQKNVNEINMEFNNVKVTALNDTGVNLLSTVKFCSVGAWTVNQPVDLTAHARDTLCPLRNLPEQSFDLYSVEGDVLYFGKGDDKKSADKRPAEVDKGVPYKKV